MESEEVGNLLCLALNTLVGMEVRIGLNSGNTLMIEGKVLVGNYRFGMIISADDNSSHKSALEHLGSKHRCQKKRSRPGLFMLILPHN